MKQKLLTLTTLLLCAVASAWATGVTFELTNLKVFPLDYGIVTITNEGNVTISSNQLQVSKATGTFTVSTTLPNSYLGTITFKDANTSKNGGFTCTSGGSLSTPVNDVYTFTPTDATTSSATFQLIGSGGTAKMGNITVTITTEETTERLSSFGSISSSKIPFTSSSLTSAVEIGVPASGSASVSSNRINWGSGGKSVTISLTDNTKTLVSR